MINGIDCPLSGVYNDWINDAAKIKIIIIFLSDLKDKPQEYDLKFHQLLIHLVGKK